MRLNFRSWLEARERKAPEDKGKPEADDGGTDTMDIFGGSQEELNIDPATLKRIYQTEPQVGAHVAFDGLNWRLMPFKINGMSSSGADIETYPGDNVQTYKNGRRVKDKHKRKGYINRKDLADIVGQGWTAVTAGAAAGGGMGGMPPL